MSPTREDFLRRYAASPIHVPRLERLLEVYGAGQSEEAFASAFIAWDRACPDGEAARVVAEILSAFVHDAGQIVRVSDEAVRGAIRLMAGAVTLPLAARARALRRLTAATDADSIRSAIGLLERACTLPEDHLGPLLESL